MNRDSVLRLEELENTGPSDGTPQVPAARQGGTRAATGIQPLLTLGEVAATLRVSERTVRRLVAAHKLPCVRIGSRLRFQSADVFRFVSAWKE
jgi:excisionase family DNA binding protein